MPVRVIDIINRAQTVLQDETNTRWSKAELLDWFNDAQLAIVNRRPDTHVEHLLVTCVAGTVQAIPPTALRLMRVLRNFTGRPIREIDIRVLDDQIPDWHEEVGASRVEHFAYNPLDPKTFYLYPSPAANHKVEVICSVAPVPVAISDFANDTQAMSLDDCYLNPVLDWVLYRAYSKDADYTSNAERAIMHLNAFKTALGEKTEADTAVSGVT